MSILKRKNKLDVFKDKTPIFFEQERHENDVIFEIKSSDWGSWDPNLSEKLDLSRTRDNWTERGYSSNSVITNYGIISNRVGIIAIALRDSNGNMEIYCRAGYFYECASHKKYINKFARDNNVSVRKDIHYVEALIINSWIKPLDIGLEFYDADVQAEISKGFFDEMKAKYPLKEVQEVNISNETLNESCF